MIHLSHNFFDELPGDPSAVNIPRQVHNACYSWVEPKGMASPSLIMYSDELAKTLGISESFCSTHEFCQIMTGNTLAEGSKPYAMCYGGHQFGSWAGQLGDGRAINLGELTNNDEKSFSLQLKGSGPTPYSRTADGLAVLRSSIREFLCSEAMYFLGVPTTRALSLCLTGEMVLRDIMYDGNKKYEKGAVVCRVSPSFIRFGSFEIFASRQDIVSLTKLADYTIAHHYPEITNGEDKYLQFFKEVAEKTCSMIIHWQRVGFVHGVMNTDNMSILGETIDYGPYGWSDHYDPNWTPNTTDLPGKRYRFGNQPIIAQWNLLKLANALFPVIEDEQGLKTIIEDFRSQYIIGYLAMMRNKLGFFTAHKDDGILISSLENLLVARETDMTIFFRELSSVHKNHSVKEAFEILSPSFYLENENSDDYMTMFKDWTTKYVERLSLENISDEEKKISMHQVNPKYVLRNYMAQIAIEKAEVGDYTLIHELYEILKKPYENQPIYEKWYNKRPDWAREKIGCSMLSCSS